MNFIFWNINKKPIGDTIAELIDHFDTDVLMIGESPYNPSNLLLTLNSKNSSFFYSPGYICEKIQVYAKFKSDLISPIEETKRITARRLLSAKFGHVNLVIAHYNSKVNWNDADQAAHSSKFKELVDSVELSTGNNKTIVCGDFNMNPFDHGMVQSTGIHSVMEMSIAKKQRRIIEEDQYPYFYNPMWGFLGDLGRGEVSGTMFYSPSKPINYHWNLFDQVIFRPDLIESFETNELNIITKFGSINLLTRNGLVSNKYSDHLPIKFSFNL